MVYTVVLEATAERIESSSLSLRTINNNKGLGVKSKNVLDRAYGSIPKECTPNLSFEIWPTYRGFRYYWLVFIRKFTR